MKAKIRILRRGVLLAGILLCSGGLAAEATSARSCRENPVGDVQFSMRRIAERAHSDPSGLWGDRELWNPNTPRGTDIWEGHYTRCDGKTVIVSQIINRQCSSETVCPVRVVLRDPAGNADRMLIDYEQACVLRDTFRIRFDAGEFQACDIPIRWE
jgi:hypothetical protein